MKTAAKQGFMSEAAFFRLSAHGGPVAVKLRHLLLLGAAALSCLSFWPCEVRAQAEVSVSKGQVVYAPVYSHIYIGDRERPFLLAATMSIRNTDPGAPIVIEKVTYYNSEGKPLQEYLQKPITLERLAATRFIVRESDTSGGSGASFIVEWRAEKPVSPPLIETVMIGAQTQQGISFTSRSRVIREK